MTCTFPRSRSVKPAQTRRFIATFILVAAGLSLQAPAASVKSGDRVLRATRIEAAPVLDGSLNDEVWKRAPRTEQFKQREPAEGDDATELTSVQVLYTARSLFFGITCGDSSPDRIVSSELRRDGDLEKDDSLWILIDSVHDHRNALLFAINSQGTQYDALVTDEGRDVNVNWDGVWRAVARRDETGWTAEIEVPFKTLRLKETTGRAGLEFRRIIRRKNEFVFWNTWDRNFQFEQVSQAGHLIGLKDIEVGTRWRLKPYVLGGTGKAGSEPWENRSNAGIEDLKWRITPTLTTDLTYRTDFAEVELDAQQSNLSSPRDQLFFPEKREFFQEGAGFFNFGAKMKENPGDTLLAFFSRRIGLSAAGQRIPVAGGGKVTGKVGAFSIGALNMQTEEEAGVGASNFSVMRARYDLFSRSQVGAIVTNRSDDDSFNRTVGVDSRFIFWKNFSLESFLLRSATPGVREEQNAYHGQAYWRTDLWRIGLGHLTMEPNFNPEMGFVERLNTRKTIFDIGFRPRPRVSWIRQIEIRPFLEYFTNNDNVVEQKIGHYNFELFLQSGDLLRYAPHARFERLFQRLRIAPGVFVPPGDYSFVSHVMEYRMDPARRLAGTFRVSVYSNYFRGDRTNFLIKPQWKPAASMIFDLEYELNRIRVVEKRFNSHIVNFGVNYSVSTRLLTSAVVQYNNLAGVKGVNLRLRYIYRPGDDLFVVYRHIRNDLNPEFSDRALLVKLTHSFDF